MDEIWEHFPALSSTSGFEPFAIFGLKMVALALRTQPELGLQDAMTHLMTRLFEAEMPIFGMMLATAPTLETYLEMAVANHNMLFNFGDQWLEKVGPNHYRRHYSLGRIKTQLTFLPFVLGAQRAALIQLGVSGSVEIFEATENFVGLEIQA